MRWWSSCRSPRSSACRKRWPRSRGGACAAASASSRSRSSSGCSILGAGIAFQFRLGPGLRGDPGVVPDRRRGFACVCAALLPAGRDGIALARRRRRLRHGRRRVVPPRARIGNVALAPRVLLRAAVGIAESPIRSSVTYAWAAEAAVLVWLSSRVRDARFQLPALAYLGFALVHAIAFEASPQNFFERTCGIPPRARLRSSRSLLAAARLRARMTRSWEARQPTRGILSCARATLAAGSAPCAAAPSTWRRIRVAAAAAAYAASLALLELCPGRVAGNGRRRAVRLGARGRHGRVVARRACCCTRVHCRRDSLTSLWIALAWLATTRRQGHRRSTSTPSRRRRMRISFLVVGAAVLTTGFAREHASATGLTAEGATSPGRSASLCCCSAGIALVASCTDGDGLVLVGAGALYVALGAARPRARSSGTLSTLLWTLGLASIAVGEAMLLEGFWLVLAYTATAASLAAISVARRASAGCRLGRSCISPAVQLIALVGEAPPSHFVTDAWRIRAQGVPSLLLVVAATAVLAWSLGWRRALPAAGDLGGRSRSAVYAASLAILEATQRISPAGASHRLPARTHDRQRVLGSARARSRSTSV